MRKPNILVDRLLKEPGYGSLLQAFETHKTPVYLHGIIKEATGHLLYALSVHTERPVLVVCENVYRARELTRALESLIGEEVQLFPEAETGLGKVTALDNEGETQRLRVLEGLASGDRMLVVTTLRALQMRLTPIRAFQKMRIRIDLDSQIDLNELSSRLFHMHYDKVSSVEAPGEFAVRGGILDIYPVTASAPYRIELFDTEVDSIRTFDVQTQRSIGRIEEVLITPAAEYIASDRAKEEMLKGLVKDLTYIEKHPPYGMDTQRAFEKYQEIRVRLEEGLIISNPNLVTPYLKASNYSLMTDYLDPRSIVYLEDVTRIYDKNSDDMSIYLEMHTMAMEAGEALHGHEQLLISERDIFSALAAFDRVNVTPLLKRSRLLEPKTLIEIKTVEAENFNRNLSIFYDRISDLAKSGEKVLIFAQDLLRAQRLIEGLRDQGLDPLLLENYEMTFGDRILAVSPGSYPKGVVYPNIGQSIFTTSEIYGSSKFKKRRTKKKKSTARDLINYADLEIGDYIVHDNHGIGRYEGIKQITVEGISKDYLVMVYRDGDKLSIPTDQMNLVQKYIGADGKAPRLSRLGGTDWVRAKQKAQKAIDEIADDLVELYAKRSKEVGFAFSSDTPWQSEFEDAFIYEETESQIRSIKEIKADMESERPMDRLLCGDVGYGKTEVAMRAAFKAVMDGKQVAMLVPTTILAQQHYKTMVDRFKNFPIKVEMLSRFRTPQQSKRIFADVSKGFIDIIIGTHRLLSKQLKFKDLGLLVIDEEQRFGVRHKEKLKALRTNIDVLTLSATPIPRTLQMGLVGIRDMSLLEEPPEERMTTTTYVMEYDPTILREAILREIAREGQVYFVYNRVYDIDHMAQRLTQLVPEASIVVAHGQMSSTRLEDVMIAFNEREYDILLSTTIIETGMDIQNVNTLIVYDADRMGLAQLYQLKGRIGRGDRSSYAYFTYAPGKVLAEASEKRLMAIRDFSEFGSGFKIAMRDLELRGAGNLLGESQHGHIDSVGYDLYVRMLEEAVRLAKGETTKSLPKQDVDIDIRMDGFIPADYIPDQNQKIEMYSRIASVSDQTDYEAILEELIDRYGDLPKTVENVLDVALIKSYAAQIGIERVKETQDAIVFTYDDPNRFPPEVFGLLAAEYGSELHFDVSQNPNFKIRLHPDKLTKTREFLAFLAGLVENK